MSSRHVMPTLALGEPDATSCIANAGQDFLAATSRDSPPGFPDSASSFLAGTGSAEPTARTVDLAEGAS